MRMRESSLTRHCTGRRSRTTDGQADSFKEVTKLMLTFSSGRPGSGSIRLRAHALQYLAEIEVIEAEPGLYLARIDERLAVIRDHEIVISCRAGDRSDRRRFPSYNVKPIKSGTSETPTFWLLWTIGRRDDQLRAVVANPWIASPRARAERDWHGTMSRAVSVHEFYRPSLVVRRLMPHRHPTTVG